MTLRATPLGRAVAASGLRPRTARYLVDYIVKNAEALVALLPNTSDKTARLAEFHALIVYACLCSPEFDLIENGGTRIIPYMLADADPRLPIKTDIKNLLAENPDPNRSRAASAALAMRWIDGEASRELENAARNLTLGVLRVHFHDLAAIIAGLAGILYALIESAGKSAATSPLSGLAEHLKRLPRLLRRTARRVEEGLPDDVLWMTEIEFEGLDHRLTRTDIRRLRDMGIRTPTEAMDQNKEPLRKKAFDGALPSPTEKNNAFVRAVRRWKRSEWSKAADRHAKRASHCEQPGIVSDYYAARQTDFEAVLERAFKAVGIRFDKTDVAGTRAHPDYLLHIGNNEPIVVEVKSKTTDKLVDLNSCIEVLSASELIGKSGSPCLTICHPGYDPSVPPSIGNSKRLCVVDSAHFAEALLRLCEGRLQFDELHRWLTTPGEALPSELPISYGKALAAISP